MSTEPRFVYRADHPHGPNVIDRSSGKWMSIELARQYAAVVNAVDATPVPEQAQPAGVTERTLQDFAIEHAEYMAKHAERFIEAVCDLERAESELEDGTANESDVHAAIETLSDAQRALTSGIYEFRKRAARAQEGEKP